MLKSLYRLVFFVATVLSATAVTVSCDDPLTSGANARTIVAVSVEMPELPDGALVVDKLYYFTNITSGTTNEFSPNATIELMPGLYDVSFSATVINRDGADTKLRANASNVNISGTTASVSLKAYNNRDNQDLIIAEIFFAGTLQPSGNSYTGDDYIKLYNNTDKVIYADGLTIFESKFTSTQKFNYTPDIRSEAITVQAIYTIPGSGTDVPVQPGEFLLIADTGIDHRVANPNSFDLSGAAFEWYDISSDPKSIDIDGPVPNLDKWYCYTQSYWMLHNRGFKCFGIARIPIDKEVYLRDYWYSYDYDQITNLGTFPMTQSAYRMPNEWVVDAVMTSVKSEYAWQVCDPSLDSGWTWCGTMDKDPTRYFHSVRRKLLYVTEGGRAVLCDTNNSTNDFNPMVTPSEIEIQGTAIDAQGTPCTKRTYDGVTIMP